MDRLIGFLNNSLRLEETVFNISDSGSDTSEEMAPIPSFEAYVEGTSFSEYIERFEAFMMLHSVDNNERSIHLIGACGAFLYSKMCSACNPRKPIDVSYEELKTLLEAVLCPKNLEFVERAKFYSRSQKMGENAVTFALSLRSIAKTCNFGNQLENHLRDRFVMGLRDETMKRQII